MINDEVQSLVEMYGKFGENEDRFIEETIINKYEKHIVFFLKKYEECNYYEDLKQELRISIIKSIRKYNKNKSSFFVYCRASILKTLFRKKRYQHLIRIPEYLDLKSNIVLVNSNYVKTNNGRNDYVNIFEYVKDKISINYDIIDRYHVARSLLSNRQYHILKLHCLGFSNRQIGKTLHLSDASISIELKTIKNKLGGSYNEN